jgi:alanine racemase
MEITRPTVLEVNLDNFKYNISQIQKKVGNDVKLMPVIKANGYGTYINKIKEILDMFEIVAVATVDEGIEIRSTGYTGEIFVLNQAYKEEIEKAISNNIILGVSSNEFIEEVRKINKNLKVHLEIETGMGRTGININELDKFIENIKSIKNIEVQGVYSHLSSADIDEEYTKSQLDTFKIASDKVKNNFNTIKYVHISASNGILNYKNSYYNLVRPGIIIYGYPSYEEAGKNIDLKPVCKFKSKITFLKEVEPETSIGYSRKFITKSKTKIATVPIGYADGLRRALSNKGEVVINGEKAPIIGNVCMDSFMVDVTNIKNVNLGDDVYIWDNEIITLEDVAKQCDTINYEIMCTISDRVPRIFI